MIGGVGAGGGGGGGGFLDHPPPPGSGAEFEPSSVVRLQRNLSLPGALREGGGNGQGGFVSTPPSAGLEGGRGYFAAVSTPRGGGGGAAEEDDGGARAGDESYAAEGKPFGGGWLNNPICTRARM